MFLDLIQNNINGVIGISAVIIAILMIINFAKLVGHKSRIEEVISRKRIVFEKGNKSNEIEENEIDDPNVNPDLIRKYEKKFNQSAAFHNTLAQLIPVFPLLGILGTIAGLILQTKAGANQEALMNSLDVALKSTLYGVAASIVLKIFDALPTYIINDVEIALDDYDKKLDILEMYQNIMGRD